MNLAVPRWDLVFKNGQKAWSYRWVWLEWLRVGLTCIYVFSAQFHSGCMTMRWVSLQRLWKNDVHMALRDANDARHINPMSSRAHHCMAEALSQVLSVSFSTYLLESRSSDEPIVQQLWEVNLHSINVWCMGFTTYLECCGAFSSKEFEYHGV